MSVPAAPAAPSTPSTPGQALADARSPWEAGPRVVTVGLVLLISLAAFESLAVTTAMPAVVEALGGLELYAMAFAAPIASSVVGMVLSGSWSDRAGPAAPLVVGVVLFVVGLVVAGAAPSMTVVVAGRVVQGLGGGMIGVTAYVVVARLYPAHLHARVFGIFAAAWVVPSVVGPALAGLITDTVGWRWVFLGVPLLAVPALVSLRPALAAARGAADGGPAPATRARDTRRVLLATAAGTGALALHWAGHQGTAAAIAAVAVGLALLGASAPRLLPRGTLRAARGLPAVILMRGVLAAGFFGAEVYLPLVLVSERGLKPAVAGLALTVAAILWSFGSWLRGRREGRWSDHRVLQAGGASLTAGVVLAAASVWTAAPVAVAIVGWGLSGLGAGLVYPTLALLTLRLSPPAEQGANTSALQVSEAITVAVVLALSGALFAELVTDDAVGAYLACFAVAFALALASALVAGRVRTEPTS